MMQLGAEGVFVGSGIFKSGDPKKRAAAIGKADTECTKLHEYFLDICKSHYIWKDLI